jgi:hypothetical protein
MHKPDGIGPGGQAAAAAAAAAAASSSKQQPPQPPPPPQRSRTAEYGITRIIVAALPRHSPLAPEWCTIVRAVRQAEGSVKARAGFTWYKIFTRSAGAMIVFETAPAAPPANIDSSTVSVCGSGSGCCCCCCCCCSRGPDSSAAIARACAAAASSAASASAAACRRAPSSFQSPISPLSQSFAENVMAMAKGAFSQVSVTPRNSPSRTPSVAAMWRSALSTEL